MNPELAALRDEIKRTVHMDDVVRMLGLPEPKNRKIRSLSNPNERTPSLHLYDYDWFDYSTGEGGDQISFVQQATGASYINALEILARGRTMTVRPRRHVTMPYEPADFTMRFENAEEPEDNEYVDAWAAFVERKWPTLTLADLYQYRCKIVANGELWIPHYHDGRVNGIKVRHLPRGDKTSVKGSTFVVGLYRPLDQPNKTHALVVEGESDAWVMAKMLFKRDVTILSLPSGAGALKDRYLDELKPFKTVGVAFDGDEPGQKAADWIWQRRSDVYKVDVPGGRVAEAAAGGWTL